MAKILCILTSPRKGGFTSQAYKAALEGIKKSGAEPMEAWLPAYTLNPCLSCFSCIRDEAHKCVQKDSMGRKGELMALVEKADAMMIADPVYCWSMTSRAHMFMERLYPLQWTVKLHGMPFAAICCASNQGMMLESVRSFCKLAYTYKMEWVNGLGVHAGDFEAKLQACEYLGEQLGRAAVRVERNGKQDPPDALLAKDYVGQKWDPIVNYIDNLTDGSFDWTRSIPYRILSAHSMKNPEAIIHMESALDKLREMITAWKLQDLDECARIFASLSSEWTQATWQEYLQNNVICAEKPAAYRSGE